MGGTHIVVLRHETEQWWLDGELNFARSRGKVAEGAGGGRGDPLAAGEAGGVTRTRVTQRYLQSFQCSSDCETQPSSVDIGHPTRGRTLNTLGTHWVRTHTNTHTPDTPVYIATAAGPR